MSDTETNSGRVSRHALVRDLVLGVRIARADVVDLWRRNDSRRQRALYGVLALLLLPVVVLFVQQGYALGTMTRDGVDFPVVEAARNLLVPGVLVFAVLGGLGAAQSLARDSVRTLLLTSAPTRAIVIGKLLYLLGTWLAPLGFLFVPVLAYAVGARSPLFPIALVLSGVPLLLLTLLVGLTLAYVLWLGIERLGLSETTRRLVTASLSMVIFVAAFASGFLSGRVTDTAEQIPTGDPMIPLGWYADLLVVGSPMAEPLGLRTVLAGVLVLAAIPLVFAVQIRVAPAFWYATPSTAEERDHGETAQSDAGSRAKKAAFSTTPSETIGRVSGVTARSPTLRAALGYARIAVRRPDQYVYLFYYVFPVLAILLPLALESPTSLPPALGVGLVMLGIWFAGSIVCLNPLGTEGAMLSQLVLAQTPARTFVHARLVVGASIGLVCSVIGMGLFVTTGPSLTPSLTAFLTPTLFVLGFVLVVGVVVTSAAFALGIGTAVPKFETIEVFDSVETLAPAIVAALVHGAISLVLAVLAVAVTVLVAVPESPLSTSARLATLGLFVLALVVISDGSRRYAIARLAQYGHERVRVDRPFAVYAALSIALLAFVLGQAVGLSVALLVGPDLSIALLLPVLFVLEYLGYALVAIGFLYVTQRGLAYLDFGWPSWREAGIVVGGVVASLAVWGTGMVLISELGLPAADHALFDAETGDPRLLLTLVPLLLFVNGPVEELLYRNVIQKYLQEWFTPGVAIGVTSGIFALAHVPAYFTAGLSAIAVTLGLLFVLSCFWGVLYARTQSLFVVSAVHGIYNAVLVGGLYVSLVL